MWRLNLLSRDQFLLIRDRIYYVEIEFASQDQIYYADNKSYLVEVKFT